MDWQDTKDTKSLSIKRNDLGLEEEMSTSKSDQRWTNKVNMHI